MTDKQIIIDGVDVLKEKINMCFILLSHKLETSETIEQTIYDHLDVFVEEWNNQLKHKEQECEELKNAYTRLNSLYNDNCNFTDKLEQTLTEIKEIAEAHKKDESVWNPYRQLDKILQKISECEVK